MDGELYRDLSMSGAKSCSMPGAWWSPLPASELSLGPSCPLPSRLQSSHPKCAMTPLNRMSVLSKALGELRLALVEVSTFLRGLLRTVSMAEHVNYRSQVLCSLSDPNVDTGSLHVLVQTFFV